MRPPGQWLVLQLPTEQAAVEVDQRWPVRAENFEMHHRVAHARRLRRLAADGRSRLDLIDSVCKRDNDTVMFCTWRLKTYDATVIREIESRVIFTGEHVGRHVGEDDVSAGQLVAMCNEVSMPQVIGHCFVPVVALGNE